MQTSRERRTFRRFGLAALIGIAGATLPLGVAQADDAQAKATPGTLEICSEGAYGSSVSFPGRGGLSTTTVPSGECLALPLEGSADEQADVTSSDTGYIGSFTYNGSKGAKICTYDGPTFALC